MKFGLHRTGIEPGHRSGGFTLVEILLAITLLSMLLALAYGGLRASTRATDRGQLILEQSGRIRMAHQFVRKQFNQMIPLTFIKGEVGEPSTVFDGSPQRVRLVGPMPGYLGFGGPQVQELTFERGEDGLALIISHALLQGFEESKLYERDPIVLLDQIAAAQFQFLGLDEEAGLTAWTSDWGTPEKLPLAVALDIEFNEEVYISWPQLTASVRIDAGALADLASDEGLTHNYNSTIQKMIQSRTRQ